MRFTRCVVPDRGNPTTMNGCSIRIDSISGYRLIRSVNDNRLRSGRTTRCRSDPRVSWRRPESPRWRPRGRPAAGVSVGVVQVGADAGLPDRFGEHLVDVEFDVVGLGELQDLTLDIGQPGQGQVVEVDVRDVGARSTHPTASSR
jgi:hypothetical protein